MRIVRTGASCVLLLLCLAAAASAQNSRSWVSGVGDDLNPCSRTAPCKTFAGAISKTIASGEINVLDPGGYGGVTITKNMTIDGGGMIAGIVVSGTNGINVNGAGIVVTLRGLDINGLGASSPNGVSITQAAQVTIENCQIYGFTDGVDVSSAAGTKVQILNSRLSNNSHGVYVSSGPSTVGVLFSTLLGNTAAGIDVGAAGKVLVSNSNVSTNLDGLSAHDGGIMYLTHADLYFNTTPFRVQTGGIIYTYVDNRIQGTGAGALTPAPTPIP